MERNRSTNQQEQETTGITNIQTQTTFSNLEMQEQQEDTQTGKGSSSQAAKEADQSKNVIVTSRNSSNNHNLQNQQANPTNKYETPGIDSMIPHPRTPNIINVTAGLSEEVSGRMDGGCREIASNLQDGVTKGGKLPHVMHEGLESDLSTDHRASNNADNRLQQGKQQQLQHRYKIETTTNNLPKE